AGRARRGRMGARGGGPRRRRDPLDQHGSRRNQGRLRSRAHARGLAGRVGAGDRFGRRRLPRASLRGARRGLRRRGAGGVDLPLRDAHDRRGEDLPARARRRDAVRAVTLDELKFDDQGLIPAVVQEVDTGEILMVAWMDRPAVEATLASGLSHFWSRSRGKPWRKGETSGHVQHVQSVFADCDADVLLVQAHQEGVACHTGQRTCFFTPLKGGAKISLRPPPAALVLVAMIALTACGGRRIENGVYHSAKGYRVTLPSPEWIVADESRADLELRHHGGGAAMLANAECDQQAAARSRDLLLRQLLIGLRDRTPITREEVSLNGRRAVHRVLDG